MSAWIEGMPNKKLRKRTSDIRTSWLCTMRWWDATRWSNMTISTNIPSKITSIRQKPSGWLSKPWDLRRSCGQSHKGTLVNTLIEHPTRIVTIGHLRKKTTFPRDTAKLSDDFIPSGHSLVTSRGAFSKFLPLRNVNKEKWVFQVRKWHIIYDTTRVLRLEFYTWIWEAAMSQA